MNTSPVVENTCKLGEGRPAEGEIVRQKAMEERAAELLKANRALQETTNALAQATNMDEIVPTMLRILTRTFDARNCGFYEVGKDVRVFLRYYCIDGHVLSAQELQRDWQGDPDSAVLRRLVEGFTVSDAYLDGNVRTRVSHTLIDHGAGTVEPEFDAWANRRGWRLELNVPLVVEDQAIGAITLMRSAQPYRDSEIELAVALSRQLTLAVQAVKLSEEARAFAVQNAVAQERERFARQRVNELEQVNAELRLRSRLLSAVAEVSTLLAREAQMDRALPTALRLLGEAGELSRVLVLTERQSPQSPADLEHRVVAEWCAPGTPTHADRGLAIIPSADAGPLAAELRAGKPFWLHVDTVVGPLRSHFDRLGIVQSGCVPFFLDEVYAGTIAFDNCVAGRLWDSVHLDALTAAANAIASAMQARRDAERMALERERAAEDRVSELAKANEALRRGVDGLLSATSAAEILTCLLKEAVHVSGASSGAVLRRVEGTEFSYIAIFAEGAVRPAQEILESGTDAEMRRASALDPTGHFRALTLGEARWRLVDDQALAMHLERSTRFHRLSGTRLIFDSPYRAGHQVGGYLGLAFRSEDAPNQSLRETIKALSNQVGLALEFRRISEENERAALEHQRHAFARDLHDTLAQGFTGILMQLGSLEQSTKVPGELTPYLGRIDELARTNLAEARRTVEELRFMEGARETFSRRLTAVVNRLRSAFGATVELELQGEEAALGLDAERELLLIVREALTNSVKHANASSIGVKGLFRAAGVQLRVWDDGSGFSQKENDRAGHYGMRSMQERAEQIGASLTVITELGYGTEVVISWNGKGAGV